MADQQRSTIIRNNPIGKGLDAFRALFNSVCEKRGISCSPNSLGQLALQILPVARLLSSKTGRGTVHSDLRWLVSAAASVDFDFDHINPLLNTVLADALDDTLIWDQVSRAVTEFTPPSQPIFLQQTPWLRKTSSLVNSSERRKDVDPVLKEELGPLYVGLRNFHETYFGGVANLETAPSAVFKNCTEGINPLFNSEGWMGWPAGADQDDVFTWLGGLIPKLEEFAKDCNLTSTYRRKLLAQPKTPLLGSTGKRSMDIGFVNNDFTYDRKSGKDFRYRWSHILVSGELKSNPSADRASIAWIDLATYAREVLSAQDSRRFVLGFTLCGSLMRIWEFDRLGGIASEQFDINRDGLRFVSTILGFLWMREQELGFDPTFRTANGQRFIEIERNGLTERLIIDEVMNRPHCLAGRATTCWRAHRAEDPRTPLVIKDSWQFPEREEEGELLREAIDKGVVNVARYYYHETVRVRGEIDDIQHSVRGELNIMEAKNYWPEHSVLSPSIIAPRKDRSTSAAGVKRSSSQTGAAVPHSKRHHSSSLSKTCSEALPNRVHRRVILCDYGKAIYKASTRSRLLAALEGCIEGHESLVKAGFLHRDISVNNLMVNEDDNNPSWPSFLIDLDLAIKVQRDGASGAKEKTGTRAFMAIGALLGEQHSFMHDLESFFWVLFWICIHFNGPKESRVVVRFEKWNYMDTEDLALYKKGLIIDERYFLGVMEECFTPYFQTLVPWVNRLRRKMFPNGEQWMKQNLELYSSIKEILRDAQKDPKVLADR